MQLTTVLASAGLVATALAAPSPRAAAATFKTAAAPQWTITSMTRPCDQTDTKCTWSFGINRNDGSEIQTCTFDITTGEPGASRTDLKDPGAPCGPYKVTTGWSNVFGDDAGFTTLSVVDVNARLIAWPSYTDAELANGATVQPDKSWDVSGI